jgi:hypothetical protein
MKIGIIGNGYFGEKIHNVLDGKYDIIFFTGRDMDITYDIDWVVIATSIDSHYDLCKEFILKGVNVFVEKPMTLSYTDSEKLIKLAEDNNVRIYIDDVFRFTQGYWNLIQQPHTSNEPLYFNWDKYGSFNDTIHNALTYHDIYMALSMGYDLSGDIEFEHNRVNQKSFTIGKVHFAYDRTSNKKVKTAAINGYTIDFKTNLNPLDTMFNNVFNNNVDFHANNSLALESQKVLDRLNKLKPKVAVVGAGIFGITSALKLSENLDVTLFEKNDDILQNASSINQYRLHRGYHYPRSIETALTSKEGTKTFSKFFDGVEIFDTEQYYAIASMGSKVSPSEYELFMKKCGLHYKETKSDLVTTNVAALYEVDEGLFDPYKMYRSCKQRLANSDVDLRLGTPYNDDWNFDYVINCTYSNLNQVFGGDTKYQFEVCEKPVVRLPSKYKGKGIVVLDGPFTCIDPYSDTDYHVVGNVVHAIHSTNVGKYPVVSDELSKLLNKSVVKNPSVTKFPLFKESLKHFFGIDEVEHIGSMYTIRTVLPNRDFDDARPSVVEKEKCGKYSVFSGKISTALDTANELNQYIMKQ